MKRSILFSGSMLSLFFLTGCGGESTAETVERIKPEYTELRSELVEITAGEAATESPDLDPVPHYEEKDAAVSNTAFLMYDQLADPDLELDLNKTVDLRYSGKLKTYLRWTGEESPLGAAGQKRKTSEESLIAIEAVLKNRYLAVAKMMQFTPIQVVGPKKYSGENAAMNGFLVDLQEMKIVRSFPVLGTPPASVNFSYQRDEQDSQERIAARAQSGVYTSLRESFVEQFEEVTGGQFVTK